MYSNFSSKNDVISLKISAFRKLQVHIELIFRFIFQFSIFMFKESSKRCLIFSYLFAAFEKPLNISRQELSFNHILKKCLISKDLLVIRKKCRHYFDRFWSTFIWAESLKILKWYCSAFGIWSSSSRVQHATTMHGFKISVPVFILPISGQ